MYVDLYAVVIALQKVLSNDDKEKQQGMQSLLCGTIQVWLVYAWQADYTIVLS
jgi:hypothetical protein